MCNERTAPDASEVPTTDELRAEIARLRAALEPFAQAYRADWHRTRNAQLQVYLDDNEVLPKMTMGPFRRAYETIVPESEQKFRD
jgi:hypothetical protein